MLKTLKNKGKNRNSNQLNAIANCAKSVALAQRGKIVAQLKSRAKAAKFAKKISRARNSLHSSAKTYWHCW